MAHFKFSVCSGIEYTILPRFDLVDRHLEHAVRQQGAQQQVIGRIAQMGRRVAVTSSQKEKHSQYDRSRNDGISHWQPSLESDRGLCHGDMVQSNIEDELQRRQRSRAFRASPRAQG